MNSGPSGFGSAPVTKVLVLATASTSVLLQQTLSARKGQAGSLIVSTAQLLVFRHLGELAFGTVLLYYFRIFERQRGSERYGAQVLVNVIASQLSHWALTTLTPWRLHSGPYGLIAANLVSFVVDIPSVQRFSVFGLQLNDKVMIYAAGAQLLFSAFRDSWHTFLTGAAIGMLYQTNLFGFRSLRVPAALSRFLGRTIGRLLGGDSQRRRVIATGPQAAGTGPPAAASAAASTVPQRRAPVQPSPEALSQLVSMGFDEERAAAALRQSNNDLQGAVSRLL